MDENGELTSPEPRVLLMMTEPAEPVRIDAAVDDVQGRVAGLVMAAGIMRQASQSEREAWRTVCRRHAMALLLDADRPDLPVDGYILRDAAAIEPARAELGEAMILGAHAGLSRHEAMVAGEGGADFIVFGTEDGSFGPEVVEMVAWWAELFVLPCAIQATVDEAGATALRKAGADFLTLDLATEPEVLRAVAAAFTSPLGEADPDR